MKPLFSSVNGVYRSSLAVLFVACVASVSVKQRAKKKRRTGVSAFCPRENGARAKIRRRGWGRGRKETLADKPLDFENRPLGLSCLTAHTEISCCHRLS